MKNSIFQFNCIELLEEIHELYRNGTDEDVEHFKERAIKNELVAKVSIDLEKKKFQLIPNQTKLAKASLLPIEFSQKENEVLVEYEMPVPGQPMTQDLLRVVLTAHYCAQSHKLAGYHTFSSSMIFPWCIQLGYLLVGMQRFGKLSDLCSRGPLYLEEMFKVSIYKGIIAEEALDALIRLYRCEIELVDLWEEIYKCWRIGYQEIFNENNINLTISTNCNLSSITTPDTLDPEYSSNQSLPNIAEYLYSKNILHKREIDVYQIYLEKHNWAYKKAQKLSGTKINLVSVCKIKGLSHNSDYFIDWIENARNLVANEANTDIQDKKTQILGESFFKIQLLSVKRSSLLNYRNERVNTQNENIGIYIQYAYARLCGIERYIKECEDWYKYGNDSPSLETLKLSPRIYELCSILTNFESVLIKSFIEPSLMVSYLYTLSRAVSSQYYHLRIKGEPFNVQRDRWAVLEKAKWILENGIELFGLTALSNI